MANLGLSVTLRDDDPVNVLRLCGIAVSSSCYFVTLARGCGRHVKLPLGNHLARFLLGEQAPGVQTNGGEEKGQTRWGDRGSAKRVSTDLCSSCVHPPEDECG